MKTILLFLSGYSQAEKRGRDEILNFARTAHWRVQCVSYAEAAASRYHLVKDFGASDVKDLLEFWKPDGCIVECGAAQFSLQPEDFPGVPTVFLDRDPSTLSSPASCVCSDGRRIAQAAFDELSATGASHFAFAGWYEPLPWSVRRQEAFADILAAKGQDLHVIDIGCKAEEACCCNGASSCCECLAPGEKKIVKLAHVSAFLFIVLASANHAPLSRKPWQKR